MAQKKTKGGNTRKEIIGFTKPGKFLFFTTKPKPIYREVQSGPTPSAVAAAEAEAAASGAAPKDEVFKINNRPQDTTPRTGLDKYLAKSVASHKGLESAMKEQGAKESPLAFAKRMFMLSVVIGLAAGIGTFVIMSSFQVPETLIVIMGLMIGIAGYMGGFSQLLSMPIKKTKSVGKEIEKDVLFAARDMIVSMRSGMPLYNAMATVSEGYGAASREFAKIIRLVQLGTPIETAVEEVSAKSGSRTFQRLMLQASTSIKVGADVVSALQEVINDVSQERVIELRRYGQRLNAIAMFYMLFGIIFPSMGIAVAAIMSTFISIFTINNETLIFALFGLGFLQFIFLNMIISSRPSFST